MAKTKVDLQRLVGKKFVCKTGSGYDQFTGSKIIRVAGSNICVEWPGYPTGYPIQGAVCITKTSSTVQDFLDENKSISKEIEELNKQIQDNNLKIEFIKDSGLEEYDEDTFKAFKILELMEKSKLTKIEKAKKIAGFVKG